MAFTAKTAACIGAVIGWFALLLQLVLIIQNRAATIPETVVRYFSFFTILTNILVAVSFTAVFANGIAAKNSFFTRPKTLTATAVYITIVGIIYNTVLRFIWVPTGWDMVANELLHLIIPVIFILFWLKFVPKQNMEWKNILPWLIYPLVYLIYTLIRGSFANWYPYPFIDVAAIGYSKALVNSAMVTVAFVVVALLFVGITKWMSKKNSSN